MKNTPQMSPQLEGYHAPDFGQAQIRLLERLCNACAVSGDEGEVRAIILKEIRPFASDIRIDALGNVLAVRRAQAENPLRVMLAAHMDEVGFMITGDDEDGIFRFEVVGGIDAAQLAGKPVLVSSSHVPGVIGVKPVHLTTEDEWKQSIPVDSLRIDIGAGNSKKVKLGDRATFATQFARLGPSIAAKALDNRLGVATLIELLRQAPANVDILAAFTVQEEVGGRGARVAAYTQDPDLAIALDCTPARDLPVWVDDSGYGSKGPEENTSYNTRLGAGPALYVADRSILSDPRLVRHFVQTAEAAGIPYQIRQPGGGGTDAGVIHKQRAGIPSLAVSTPGRYIHTTAALSRLEDWKNTFFLVHAALSGLTRSIFDNER